MKKTSFILFPLKRGKERRVQDTSKVLLAIRTHVPCRWKGSFLREEMGAIR